MGQVYEIRDNVYKTAVVQEKGHQESSGKVVLDEGHFEYGIGIRGNKNQYNYFCIQLKNLSVETVNFTIDFQKQKDNIIVNSNKEIHSLHEGMNLIDVPQNSYNVIAIGITGENNISFYIEKMQLRETKPVFNGIKALKIMVFSYLIYTLISGGIIFIWRKMGISFSLYSWIELLQDMYILLANQCRKITEYFHISKRVKNAWITVVFVLMFLYNVWVEMLRIYYTHFKYHAVVYSILILIITILSIEPKPVRKRWNNNLVWSWLVLWGMACVSDFLLTKNFRFVGYIMIFIVGFFIFVWNNMEKPDELIKDFVRAVHIFLGFIVIFCLMCRPEAADTVGIRYSGISKNPSIFALYLGSMFAVILGELDNSIKKDNAFKKKLLYILEGCIILAFCWKAQSLCPLLCIAGISFIWFVKMAYYTRKHKCRKMLAAVIVSAAVLLVPTYICIDWGVKHIPQSLGISVVYEGEEPIARQQYGMVVYAGDLKEKIAESRLGQKFSSASLSGILSGRDYYYRTYLREMNLFGHKENPKMWGVRRLPHNAVIGIAYRYGVFACVPYILMLVLVIIRTYRYSNKKVSYASVPFYVSLVSITMSMADNVEQPFIWLPWIGMYLMMGIVFDDSRVDDQADLVIEEKVCSGGSENYYEC